MSTINRFSKTVAFLKAELIQCQAHSWLLRILLTASIICNVNFISTWFCLYDTLSLIKYLDQKKITQFIILLYNAHLTAKLCKTCSSQKKNHNTEMIKQQYIVCCTPSILSLIDLCDLESLTWAIGVCW
jgi:hypothetical protein